MQPNNIISHESKAKAHLLEHLIKRLHPDAVLINELALEKFSRRADIGLINGKIELFEIKSEADNLKRLTGQIATFSKFCDKLYIVAATCHLAKVLESTPVNVAVWELKKDGKICRVRSGRQSYIKDKSILCQLMNVNELNKITSEYRLSTQSRRRKHLEEAVLKLPLKSLRQEALNALKKRYIFTTECLLEKAKDSRITPASIELLKRTKRLAPRASDLNNQKSSNHDIYLSKLAEQTEDRLFGNVPEHIKSLFSN